MADMKLAPVPVVLDMDGTKLSANPAKATVYWETGPDSVMWDVTQILGKAAAVAIEFDAGSPFKAMGQRLVGGIIGTENTKVTGEYKYTIIAYAADGKEIARLDPRIQNNPRI